MKNKIFNSLRMFFVLVVAILICLPFLKQAALRQTKNSYLKEFVSIKKYSAKADNSGSSAKIIIVIDNAGDMILDKIPLKISYLDADKTLLSSDEVDLLKVVNDVVLAKNTKSFSIDVTLPKGCRFISPQIKY